MKIRKIIHIIKSTFIIGWYLIIPTMLGYSNKEVDKFMDEYCPVTKAKSRENDNTKQD